MNPNHQFIDRLKLEEVWPELFEGMTQEQRREVMQPLTSGWLEGWRPDYESTRDMTLLVRGVIDHEEHRQRILNRRYTAEPVRV